MTQREIKKERKRIGDELNRLHGEIEVARARLGALQTCCGHPKKRTITVTGEPCMYCPDCEWQS